MDESSMSALVWRLNHHMTITIEDLKQELHLEYNQLVNLRRIAQCISRTDLLPLPKRNQILDCMSTRHFWEEISSDQAQEFISLLVSIGAKDLILSPMIQAALAGVFDVKHDVYLKDIFKEMVINCFASPDLDYATIGSQMFDILIKTNQITLPKDVRIIQAVLDFRFGQYKSELIEKGKTLINLLAQRVSQKQSIRSLKNCGNKMVEAAQRLLKINNFILIKPISFTLANNHLILGNALSQLIPLLKQYYQHPDFSQKRDIIKILSTIALKFPSFYKKDKACFYILLEVIFLEMTKISETLDESWLSPKPGVQYIDKEDPNQEPILYGMTVIDEIFENLDCKELFSVFKQAINGMSTNSDWRYKYAAIMALSQISEYLKKKSDIKDIFEIIFQHVNDPHPRIRFACFQAIGQTVDDKRQLVFKMYFDRLLQTILAGFDDPVPYVRAHAFACFANFIQNCEYQKVKPYIIPILNKTTNLLTCNIPIVIVNALCSLREIFQILSNKILNINYKQILIIVENLFESQFKIVRQVALETGSMLLVKLSQQDLDTQFLDIHIKKMKDLCMTSLDSEFIRPHYVLLALRQLTEASNGNLLMISEAQMLFQFLSSIVVQIKGKNNQLNFNIVFDLSFYFIKKTNLVSQELFEAADGFLEICNTFDSVEIRQGMWSLFSSLGIKALSLTSPFLILQLVEKYLNYCLFYVEESFGVIHDGKQSMKNNQTIIRSLKSLINQIKCILCQCKSYITSLKLTNIVKLIESTLVASLQLYSKIDYQSKAIEFQGDDEEQERINNQMLKVLEDIVSAIIQLSEQIYKSYHGNINTRTLIKLLVNSVCERCLSFHREGMLKNGLFIIDDVLDYYEYADMPQIWKKCLHIYLENCVSQNHSVRHAGCFGLGLWISKSPLSEVKLNYEVISQTLLKCLHTPPDEEDQNSYFFAQDNVATAIGYLIEKDREYPRALVLLDQWLNYLPLKHDLKEKDKQHSFLMEWFSVQSPAFNPLTHDGLVRLTKVLRIFAELYNVRGLCNALEKKRIEQELKNILAYGPVIEKSTEIWDLLNEEDKTRLLEIQIHQMSI